MESLKFKIDNANRTLNRKEEGYLKNHENLKKLYETAKGMKPHEVMKLVMNAKDEDERSFYTFVVNMNLQRNQKKTIERNLF